MVNKALALRLAKNQALRFIFSAGMGFLVDISTFYLLYHNILKERSYEVMSYTLRNSTISLSISFSLGVIVNFLITRYLVFHESKSRPAKQFTRFVLVAFVGFFANLAVVEVLIKYFEIYPPLARILAALSLFFASFFIHKVFSFSLSLRHHAP